MVKLAVMNLFDQIQHGERKTLELKLQLPQHEHIANNRVIARVREKGDFVDTEFYRPVVTTAGQVADSSGKTDDYGRLRTITDDLQALSADESALLLYLLDHEKISRLQASEHLATGKSKAHSLLSGLLVKGLITRQGQGRSTCYVLTPAGPSPQTQRGANNEPS